MLSREIWIVAFVPSVAYQILPFEESGVTMTLRYLTTTAATVFNFTPSSSTAAHGIAHTRFPPRSIGCEFLRYNALELIVSTYLSRDALEPFLHSLFQGGHTLLFTKIALATSCPTTIRSITCEMLCDRGRTDKGG